MFICSEYSIWSIFIFQETKFSPYLLKKTKKKEEELETVFGEADLFR